MYQALIIQRSGYLRKKMDYFTVSKDKKTLMKGNFSVFLMASSDSCLVLVKNQTTCLERNYRRIALFILSFYEYLSQALVRDI